MINIKKIVTILMFVSFPLIISGCGVKGDPLVPAASVAAP